MALKKKIVWLPYDFDTAIGINNEGSLVFGYELEDTDHLTGGADVYNGQDSVVWNNIRMAFHDELASMYQTLRSTGALSYQKVEDAFEEHQSKWSEKIVNEDQKFKYIDPLTNPDTGENPTAVYLPMLQGLKTEQRKWWLYNRFRYIDSKYNAGDALTDVIQLRGYAKANIIITPYADIYPAVKYGSYLVTERGHRGTATTLVCPLDNVNDTEIYIYSASQLASIGDLSGLKVGFADFSMATKIQNLKIGDSSSSYSNTNLNNLVLGNNVLLKTLDVRNCTALGTGDQKTVDISGCVTIEEVYFDGTQVNGVTLPNGGVLEVLHLPSTITNLTIMNQSAITDLTVAGYSNISTFRIENCPTIDTKTLLNTIPSNTRVRLIGFYWTATNATEIEALLDRLDLMRGLDESGNNVETAQVSGEIHTGSLTGSQIASYNARYPYLKVTADHTSSVLRYYNGTTLLKEETILDGGNGSYTGTTPTKTQDAQYTYTFSGWSKDSDDNTVDSDALNNVVADRNVYACFTGTLRKYTVTFVRASADGGGILQTLNNVDYGTVITASSSYTGSTPTTTQGDATDYPFEGWEPASTTVQDNTTFTAKFGSPIDVSEISDTWDQIISNIDNGTYSTKYNIGQYKPLDLGTEGTINMQIVAIDADELAGGGYAPLTFLGMELLTTTHRMNPANDNRAIGTGGNGGWENCEMRSYLTSTILPLITTASATVASRLQRVKKIQSTVTDGTKVIDGQTTYDKLWIPSNHEIFGTTDHETTGHVYTTIYNNATARIKYGSSSASNWWVRSASSVANFRSVNTKGNDSSDNASVVRRVALGFCLGLQPETITDSWETILANENPSETYSIGDTKSITINNEPHLMQIVGFGVDDKTSGGKAKISWLMKDQLTTTHRMNATDTNADGWPATEMRSWLRDTILPTIDSSIRSHIVDVNKTYYDYTDSTTETISDNVWLASAREIFGGTSYESSGPDYTTLFTDATSRIKKRSGLAKSYWLRSAYSGGTNTFRYVGIGGYVLNSYGAGIANGVCVGFCT